MITNDTIITRLLGAQAELMYALDASTDAIERSRLREIGIDLQRAVGHRTRVLAQAELARTVRS